MHLCAELKSQRLDFVWCRLCTGVVIFKGKFVSLKMC